MFISVQLNSPCTLVQCVMLKSNIHVAATLKPSPLPRDASMYRYMYFKLGISFKNILSVESQKGTITIQRCSVVVNQKSTITVQSTVEPHYNEVLGTMKITLLYQVSHYIRVKKKIYIKSWDHQNYLVIRGFCYIRPLYITRFHCTWW